jgi:hypothetical protein
MIMHNEWNPAFGGIRSNYQEMNLAIQRFSWNGTRKLRSGRDMLRAAPQDTLEHRLEHRTRPGRSSPRPGVLKRNRDETKP